MLRRRRPRPAQPQSKADSQSDNDNSDEDDIFGARKRLEEEQALAERRRRIAQSAIQVEQVKRVEHGPQTKLNCSNNDTASNMEKKLPASPQTSDSGAGGAGGENQSAEPQAPSSVCAGDGAEGKKQPTDLPGANDGARARSLKRRRVNEKHEDSAVFDMFERGAVAPIASASTVGSSSAAAGVDAPVEVEGYARVRPGETLRNGRYVVSGELGRGVFASVVRATERTTGRQVAIKLSRANAAMRRAALRELGTLRHVHESAAAGTEAPCIVRVVDDFVHRDAHVAIVFELLTHTLRDIVRQHVQGVRLAAVRVYAAQLLRALAHLARADVVHADVKPDNVLLASDRATLRLADFGCALRKEHRATAPNAYLAARFYRAPESVLGLTPTTAVDTWAAACVLFELYTGNVCFPAASNNALLCATVDARGDIPARMCRRAPAPCRDKHFDNDGRLLRREVDPVTGVESVTPRPRRTTAPSGTVRDAIMRASAGDDQGIAAPLFAELIEAMLTVDPAKRIAPSDALRHPFFKEVPNS